MARSCLFSLLALLILKGGGRPPNFPARGTSPKFSRRGDVLSISLRWLWNEDAKLFCCFETMSGEDIMQIQDYGCGSDIFPFFR